MAQPFNESTWSFRSACNNADIFGTYAAVTGLIHAVYDPESGVVQAFGKSGHHFQGFANTAQGSVDHGVTWTTYFNTTQDPGYNQVAVTGWSMPHPSGSGRVHFQVRYRFEKAFLIADGTLQPGGVDLYYSENGIAWTFQQTLHSWPGINQIGGNGGAVLMNITPNATQAVLIEGSGPDGEDAYWFLSSYSLEAGGAGNRTTVEAATLWRSIDGGYTWDAVRDMEPETGVVGFASINESSTGRLIIVTSGAGGIYYTDGDLLTGSFTVATFNGASGVRGSLIPMYGGTWLTFSQGTLTGPGAAWVSCDDCATFEGTGVDVVPTNQTGFMAKIGPSEALIVAPGFSDPTTETTAAYSDDGGETFVFSEPWLSSITGESPCMLALRTGARPIVVTRGGNCYVSSDSARGTFQTRTMCPLANAGLAAASKLLICGAPIAINECSEE